MARSGTIFLAVVVALAALLGHSAARAGEDAVIRVTMLGTGTPLPVPGQYGPSTLIEAGGRAFLFDCGRGCGIRLAQARRPLFNSIDGVFLSHLHSDHIVGLPDLWLNGWTQGRSKPLAIWGPAGTRHLIAGLRSAFAFDIHMRGEVEQVPSSMAGLGTEIVEIAGDGVIFESDGVTITAFEVDHAAIKPAFGFRIDFGGRSVVLSGDTRPAPNLLRYGTGVDVFVLDVISPMMIETIRARRTPREAAIIIGHHTTAGQAAELFGQIKPRLAVYSHTLNRPDIADDLISVTRADYKGPLLVAQDLMEISVGDKITVQPPGSGAAQTID